MPLADLSRFIPSLFPPTDFLRLVIYCIFFLILFNFYSFPLHILRELFVTVTSFIKRLKDIIRARRATANLNTRWVDGHGSVGAA
jgi:E3 ubiquitin-protein ligase synoviolin